MTNLVTSKFKTHTISQIIESLTEPANTSYYLLVGDHIPYTGGDSEIPNVTESVENVFLKPYQTGIFGKRISSSDLSFMIKRYDWTSNTVYEMYDEQDDELQDKQFYVVTSDESNFFVYKVLDNNNGAPSIQKPTDILESACNFITTSDGYKWKLMCIMSSSFFQKFATDEFMPIVTSSNVASNSTPGAIDVVKITYPGSGYVTSLSGQFNVDDLRFSIPTFSGGSTNYRLIPTASSNNGFYVGSAMYISSGTGSGQLKKITSYIGGSTKVITVESDFNIPPDSTSSYLIAPYVEIKGDGTNAEGYAVVSNNATVNSFIQNVVITNRGESYTYGQAIISGNTGGISNSAVIRPIIPPKGGHGSNGDKELFSSYLGISVNLSNNENGFVTTENDYRSVSILKDPLFNGVTLTLANTFGNFSETETIHQCDIKLLAGNVNVSSTNTEVVGTSTDFYNSLKSNDKVLLADPVNNLRCLRTVVSVNNTTQTITVNSLPSFTTSSGRVYFTDLLCSGVRAGNTLPYVELSNAEPKFVIGKIVIGESSGTFGNVTAIDVNEKSYNNWLTFDNRLRFQYTSKEGIIDEDTVLYQGALSLANCYYHSANDTYVFVTDTRGVINMDPIEPLLVVGSNSSFTLGSNKYNSDIQKGSGEILYKENYFPVSRSNNQSETIKIILSF